MSRTLLLISGADAETFLQGLVTNDVTKTAKGLVYAALLTPQGKYLADFFLSRHGDGFILDVASELAALVQQRLTMYRLRADVAIDPLPMHVHRGLGDVPADGMADPRHAALGWRAYRDAPDAAKDTIDWDALRVAHAIPESGIELSADSFILEMGFEQLNGVDFRKGCYVGQEVTARMKHKTALRKGLARVAITGPVAGPVAGPVIGTVSGGGTGTVPAGTPINRDGREIGKLFTQSGGHGLAYLRFDRAGEGMTADGLEVSLSGG